MPRSKKTVKPVVVAPVSVPAPEPVSVTPVEKKGEVASSPSDLSKTLNFGKKYKGLSYTEACQDKTYINRLRNSKMCKDNVDVKEFLSYCDSQ